MPRLFPRSLPLALLALALAACGGDKDADAGTAAGEAPLPQPQQAGGSITQMPARPGPGAVPLAGDAPPTAPTLLPADEHFGLPPLEDNPETGLATTEAADNGAEPTASDAAAVLQAYYAAINTRDFAQAYAAWSDGGRSSGLTPEQYREKWGLPPDYPMVAPNYAAARSQLAKKMGLGQQRRRR